MAKDKKSFVLYCDLLKVVEKLIEQDRENKTNYSGELFYHILQYVNDKNPIPIDFIVDLAFEPIKCQLKRDLVKYEVRQEQRTEAGRRSAEQRKLNEAQRNATKTNDRSVSCPVTVTDNVTDNGNVNDNAITKVIEREESPPQIQRRFLLEIEEVEEYLLSEIEWKTTRIATPLNLNIEKVDFLIKEFSETLKGRGEEQKTPADAKSHFYNWIKNKPNGTHLKSNPPSEEEFLTAIANGVVNAMQS